MKNQIGIDSQKAEKLGNKLNLLLSDYQLYYQNLRGFHWNIKGRDFFELHLKFEELYTDANLKIDEIAERILTLGHTPFHTFSTYLKETSIRESGNISNGIEGLQVVVENLTRLILLEREILVLANDAGDEGTITLMSDYITQSEKLSWMLRSYLA